MSYAIMVWRVDIDELKSWHGCKDAARLAKLMDDPDVAEAIGEYAEEHEEEIEEGMPSLDQALRNIAFGETTHTTPDGWSGTHVRALELLIEASGGVSLNNDEVSPISAGWVGDIKVLSDLVYSKLAPIPIPEGNGAVGHFSAAEVGSKLTQIEGADLAVLAKGQTNNDEATHRILKQYKTWLSEAKKAKQGLVAFLY
jgi:hypothetical protein